MGTAPLSLSVTRTVTLQFSKAFFSNAPKRPYTNVDHVTKRRSFTTVKQQQR
jgi:hypothetical protein